MSDSQLSWKRTEAFCRDASTYQGMLNNGRSCTKAYQCKSRLCNKGKCDGLYKGQTCNNHEDCDAMLFCKMSSEWPWTSECADLKQNYEECNDTYECKTSAFCWYATSDHVAEGNKSCLPLNSQEIGTQFGWKDDTSEEASVTGVYTNWNEAYIGQYCASGLAFKHYST